MKTVNVHEAKSTLSQLLVEVEHSERVVIARNGTPVAELVPHTPTLPRIRGSWRVYPGWENYVFDPEAFAPMTDEELAELGLD